MASVTSAATGAPVALTIGLTAAKRDPETLAASILARIVARFDELYLRPPAA